jgi:hypothetical protein
MEKESADKPGSVEDSHSSGSSVAGDLKQPTRELIWADSNAPLFGLAPGGVYPASAVANTAVRSYRHHFTLTGRVRRYIFCGTFRGLAPPRRYLAPCPMEPGLSSEPDKTQRLSGRLQPLGYWVFGVLGSLFMTMHHRVHVAAPCSG